MSDEANKLTIDQSSIIGLKAELLRKQEEFRPKKPAKYGGTSTEYETNKTQSTWGKKKPDPKVVTKIDEEVKDNQDDEADKMLEQSKKMLEAKAKYYEEVVVGKKQTEEGDDELFLVDFDRKVAESSTAIEETDDKKFKLKREIDENSFNEELRLKWEKEALENLDRAEIHYANLRYDEIRNMGVGNYKFSTDDETRKAQMEFFKNIESETKMNRILNEIHKLKREKILIERLTKVKQRRLLKFGYTLEQINSLPNYQTDLDEIDQEIANFENIIKNPDLINEKVDESVYTEEREKNLEFKRRKAKTREWDKPKLKEKIWKDKVDKLRNQRLNEFAPPTSYDSASKQKRRTPQ